jgi:hypothetical protein
MTPILRCFVAVPLIVAIMATSANAKAQNDEACIAASERAVPLESSGKFIEARKELALCTAPACPDPVRLSCEDRLKEINRKVPSIVFEVKDGRGNDLAEVRLLIDGALYTDRSRGAAITLDPGTHDFRFEVHGQEPVSKQFVMRETEQDRRVVIVIGPTPPGAEPLQARPPQAAPPAPTTALVLTPGTRLDVTATRKESAPGGFQRTMGTLLLAVALPIGVIATATLGIVAQNDWSSAKQECASGACGPGSQAQHDLESARSNATNATISTIATGAALVGGIVLRVTAPSRPTTPPPPTVVPVVGSTGGGLVVKGGFQ